MRVLPIDVCSFPAWFNFIYTASVTVHIVFKGFLENWNPKKQKSLRTGANATPSVPYWTRIQNCLDFKGFQAAKTITAVCRGAKVDSGSLPTSLKRAVKSILGPLCPSWSRVLTHGGLTRACAATCLKRVHVDLRPHTQPPTWWMHGVVSCAKCYMFRCPETLLHHSWRSFVLLGLTDKQPSVNILNRFMRCLWARQPNLRYTTLPEGHCSIPAVCSILAD